MASVASPGMYNNSHTLASWSITVPLLPDKSLTTEENVVIFWRVLASVPNHHGRERITQQIMCFLLLVNLAIW